MKLPVEIGTFELPTTAQGLEDLLAEDRANLGANRGGDMVGNWGTWTGADSAEDAAAVFARGHAPSTERVRKASEGLNVAVPRTQSVKPEWRTRRAVGQRFDLERVLDGSANPWGRYENGHNLRGGSRIVTLYLPMGGHSGLTTAQISEVPLAGLVIADALEAAGYRCEIWGAGATRAYQHGRWIGAARFKLKDADQPMDLNHVAKVGYAPTTRAFLYAAWGAVAERSGRKIGAGHGGAHPEDFSLSEAFGDSSGIDLTPSYDRRGTLAEIQRVIALFQ